MKRFYITLIIALCSTLVFGQAVHVFHDGEAEPKVIANGGIQKISFQPKFLGSTEYQQVYETLDGEFRFDKVDSVKFNLPHLVSYKREYILPIDIDYFFIRFSSSYEHVTIPNLGECWNDQLNKSCAIWRFNAPSREAIYKRVMQLSEGDTWTYDYETFVAFDQEVMSKARAAAKAKSATPKDTRKFIERAPQIVNDKFMPVAKVKRNAPAVQAPNLNIPKDKTLIPADQYKGDIHKSRRICVQGTMYVVE